MQDLNNLDTVKKANTKLEPFKRKEIKQLESYFKQGKYWYNVRTGKREVNK